jgi:alpha-L-rhamnosidase
LETRNRRGARQTAYKITVGSKRASAPDLWDSGWVKSDATHGVVYAGQTLAARQRAWWRVEVRDELGQTAVSAPAFWEMGLLTASDWSARWIGSTLAGGPESSVPSPYLRTAFNVTKPVADARLFVTALGLYEFFLNGVRVGEEQLAPGWTDYSKRVQYQAYDVTGLVRSGDNAAGAILGDGWYSGRIGWRSRGYYGEQPKLLAQLVITYRDGSTDVVASDVFWKTTTGAISENDIMAGETHDARRELPGWNLPGYDDEAWLPVTEFPSPAIEISPSIGPLVRVTQELKPIAPPRKQEAWPEPVWIFDLGQNLAGRIRLRVKGPAGQMLKIRYAEILNPADNQIYVDNLRAARCTDFYTLRGDPAGETFEPKFTFHGFRYVEVSGHVGDMTADAVTGIVLHSDTPRTGDFECNDPLINQLQRNIDWGQRGNFIEVPTDCPQRNERLGWMGDAQVFIRTAAWNRDVAGFFNKWQRDISDAQGPEGEFPAVVPHVNGVPQDGGPAWADAGIICPWTIYLCYGDTTLLRTHYGSLKRFIAYLKAKAKNLIRVHPDLGIWQGFGDWLALDGSGKVDGGSPKDLIGTALFAYSTELAARIAGVLGETKDAAAFTKLHSQVRSAYQKRYVSGDGLVTGLTQTAYVLTLQFDLAPEALRPKLVAELVRDIEQRGNLLTTGFVGASYLPHVLSRFGRLDVAYKLLHQKKWPSWLYAVTQGATTIWERWDGWTQEKGFQDKGMNSFNHYAYGAIGCWLYQIVAGIEIDPAQPAYKHIVLRPQPGGELTCAHGHLQTVHGEVSSAWKLGRNQFDWQITVPANTTATATFPVPTGAKITEGGKAASSAAGVTAANPGTFKLAAGRYSFSATWKA